MNFAITHTTEQLGCETVTTLGTPQRRARPEGIWRSVVGKRTRGWHRISASSEPVYPVLLAAGLHVRAPAGTDLGCLLRAEPACERLLVAHQRDRRAHATPAPRPGRRTHLTITAPSPADLPAAGARLWRGVRDDAPMQIRPGISVDEEALAAFCQRHRIRRLALFGSALRADFHPTSDIDVLVDFEPGAAPGLLRIAQMELELVGLLGGRDVEMRTYEDLSRHFRDTVRDQAITCMTPPDDVRIRHLIEAAQKAVAYGLR